jgi:MarR family transcriptional regulator, negative regulator of the multidrug operon emrRAB
LLDASADGLSPNVLAEREALSERHAMAGDRRAVTVRLTSKGKRLAKRVFKEHSHWIGGLYGNLDAAERKQLAGLLEKVAANLADAKT